MKSKTTKRLCFSLLTTVFMTCQSHAVLNITNFTLSATSVSFDVSGTFPSTVPATNRNTLLITNAAIAANPGFALGSFIPAISSSFSGTQSLSSSVPIATGNSILGDYFYVAFDRDFSSGESISGHIAASWDTTVFDPVLACDTNLNAFWGWGGSGLANTGTLIATEISVTCVPESSTSFLSASSIGLLMLRRRRA